LEIPYENTRQSAVPNPQIQDVLRTRANPKGKDCASWRSPYRRSAPSERIPRIAVDSGAAKAAKSQDRREDRVCAICHFEFTDYNDVVADHEDPKGMGGAWRDDHPSNVGAVHWWCNSEKGSTRTDD